MKRDAELPALAVAGFVFLGLFSLLFTVGSALNLWPPAPEGRFLDLDLAVGVAFGIALLFVLLRAKGGP